MADKVALITGAARGIGLATTKLMLTEGWRIAMLDRDRDELSKASTGLDGATPFFCDVSIAEQVAETIPAILETFGRLDAVVNNAGVAEFGPIEATDFGIWRRVMETNLDGVFLVSQASIPALRETRGALVNIASISGL
ncbi:MAG: SDR family NAD(P)-dependent oxidoreductase, partial [Roseibium sp.]|nr:SDR family NAD(P)-dependent oxidoreductase [Roseibium sp.]